MPALRKFTTTYSESEDRLRLLCEPVVDVEGTSGIALWLTQRMTNRLVQVLTQWVDEDAQGGNIFDPALQNAWAQEAAAQQLEPAPPVAPAPDGLPLLVASVDLAREDDAYVVVFRADAEHDDPPYMRLSDTELRQWLGIVHGLYRAAGWPLAVWPDWFEERAAAAPASAVLH